MDLDLLALSPKLLLSFHRIDEIIHNKQLTNSNLQKRSSPSHLPTVADRVLFKYHRYTKIARKQQKWEREEHENNEDNDDILPFFFELSSRTTTIYRHPHSHYFIPHHVKSVFNDCCLSLFSSYILIRLKSTSASVLVILISGDLIEYFQQLLISWLSR